MRGRTVRRCRVWARCSRSSRRHVSEPSSGCGTGTAWHNIHTSSTVLLHEHTDVSVQVFKRIYQLTNKEYCNCNSTISVYEKYEGRKYRDCKESRLKVYLILLVNEYSIRIWVLLDNNQNNYPKKSLFMNMCWHWYVKVIFPKLENFYGNIGLEWFKKFTEKLITS